MCPNWMLKFTRASSEFIPLSKVKKHPIFFSHSGYVIPQYQLGIKMKIYCVWNSYPFQRRKNILCFSAIQGTLLTWHKKWKYCTISIDSSVTHHRTLWSGPNFGRCHTSLWLWSHEKNGSKKKALIMCTTFPSIDCFDMISGMDKFSIGCKFCLSQVILSKKGSQGKIRQWLENSQFYYYLN